MNKNLYDVIVVGGGPAGLTAGLYLARAKYRVLVVEQENFGGQITITDNVVNYPGVESSSGEEITSTMRKQAQSFGAEFLLAGVESVNFDGDIKEVNTSRGKYQAFGIVLATGAHPRSIGFSGEEEFKGRGVAYCATCDGEFFTGKDVFVVGGGFAAAEEAVFLTRYAKKVTMLIRKSDFGCAKSTADLAKENENIEIHYNTVVEGLSGGTILESLRYRNTVTGEVTEYRPSNGESFGVFVFAGYEPSTKFLSGIVELDEYGYILTDRNQKTSIDGIYAAGDVCVKNLRQMVTATADGAIAATELEHYVTTMHEKTGIMPDRPSSKETHEAAQEKVEASSSESFFTSDVKDQLSGVFEKMDNSLILRVYLDDSSVSEELRIFMQELTDLTDKLTLQVNENSFDLSPRIEILSSDGKDKGLSFNGVPGGHEFNSFVIGLYNAAGPGQALDEETLKRIQAIKSPVSIKVLVSLSCTKCPELVMAAQKIASENENIRADVYDLNHFQSIKDEYNVMSVPCLVVNDKDVTFGKMNVVQLLDYLESVI
ncbi:FAD-dependent oxidoreductase [Peptostreptococcus faecalis]|uniref:FAD-dependent oxidoreductase n=1 Tax=Peptostreptococcus faecalis TaxID=2045015 RepID=UPI000C7DC7DE|nr:FAD-dependent oxidoreductase [Peptostreptococcus faecalis]